MKYYIKPVERTSALGVTNKSSDTYELGGGSDTAPTKIQATKSKIKRNGAEDNLGIPFNDDLNKFIVWDDEPKDNPYYDIDGKLGITLPSNWIGHEQLLKQKQVPDQTLAELKFNLPKDTLTDKLFTITGSNQRDFKEVPLTFIEKLRRIFQEGSTVFDTDLLEDYIWIKAMKLSASRYTTSLFAASREDCYSKPEAMYYIFDEEKEISVKVANDEQKLKAQHKLGGVIFDWNSTDRKSLAYVLDMPVNKDSKDDLIKSLLTNYLESDDKKVLAENRKRFIKYVDMWKSNVHEFNHLTFIKKAISEKIILKAVGDVKYYYYPTGSQEKAILGSFAALERLLEKENKEILEDLKSQLVAKGHN